MKKIENNLLKIMACLAIIVTCLFLTHSDSKASGNYYGGYKSVVGNGNAPNVVLNGVTNTNSISSNGWPALLTNTSSSAAAWMTNVTTFSIAPYQKVCLAATCASTTVSDNSNAVWMIGRLINYLGTTPTNTLNTNQNGSATTPYEVLGYITNSLNGTNQVTSFGTFSYIPQTTSYDNQSACGGIAGCDTLCVIALQCPGITSLTNYQVYVNGYQ